MRHPLPDYFRERLGPALGTLLTAAAADGAVRPDVGAQDLLYAVALLCQPVPGQGPEYGRRMVSVLVDGLRIM
ncbi:SbtR family transcriptional regulator [Tsukamurella soli]|uniref:Transcriptional regulator SbtR-like C-terminal domain-containing protein n=1 Tax=Tsukamurella soli TaxID=644556 RepID=A0ABP8J207_9ACTN